MFKMFEAAVSERSNIRGPHVSL